MRKALIALAVIVVLALGAMPAQAKTKARTVCYKWNGRPICLVIRPYTVPTPKGTVVQDGGGWLY